MNQVIRFDLNSGRIYREEVMKDLKLIGGRGFSDHIINSEVDASCDPMGPHNKLVIATGLLPDPRISSAGRLSFGAKSPLTGGIKESNSGGDVGHRLASLGIRSIVIEGKPQDDGLYVLIVKADGCELARMNELTELGNYDLNAKLQAKFGRHTGIISIGNAGETGLPAAGIACTDIDGSSSRFAARGGLGAVMGSKRIKAIVVEAQGRRPIPVSDVRGFPKALKEYHAAIRGNKITNSVFPSFGTSSSIDTVNYLGGLPTKNFSEGSFNLAGEINAQALSELVKSRGGVGSLGKPCMAGCFIGEFKLQLHHE
jgi:aldehyde:ferredoxin oxidoreductase